MREHTPEDLIKEVMWENHQVEEGVAKYLAQLKKTTQTTGHQDTKGGKRLLSSTLPVTIEAIQDAYKVAENELLSAKGNTPNWLFLIGMVKPEQAAVIAMNHMIKHVSTPGCTLTLTTLANNIGKSLREQLMFENWKKVEKQKMKEHNKTCEEGEEYSKSFAELLIERAKGQITRPKLARWKKKFDTYSCVEWGDETVVIGMKLIDIVTKANPDVFTYTMRFIKGKKQRLVAMTDQAYAEMTDLNDGAAFQCPLLLPTLILPKEWHYKDGQIEGGYHHLKQPLFSERISKHTAADKGAPSQEFLDSINAIQATEWSINPYMNMVINMIVGTDRALGGVPRICELVAPTKTEEDYNALTKEQRSEFLKKRHAALDEIASQRGRHGAFVRKLNIAKKLLAHSKFYFPHFADFRGRLYPMPQELTPQGDDVAKSLLHFAKGEKLGPHGLYWLKVHAANCFGKDKDTLEQREQWATDNLDNMAEWTIDPLNNDGWAQCDEAPLGFLAACKELTEAHELEDPTQYVSHLPVAMDGTCNGMQLLSLLGRDNVGAEKTNCRSNAARYDLYSEVASKVMEICEREKSVNIVAAEWLVRLKGNPAKARKVVKRAVMTTPYGVTGRGIAQQLVNDKHCNDLGEVSRASASDFMKDCILEAMSEVNGKAVEIMAYFQNTSAVLASEGSALSWYTPMGLRVTQAYFKQADKRIQTVLGTVTMWQEDKAMGLDQQKQFQSAAPNVIHSFDAAMLQLTVAKMFEKGYTDFAMIHDSYGMHAGIVEELHVTLREAAFEIFSADNLNEFYQNAQSQTELTLPQPPTAGNYNMSEILNAPYFFS